MDRKNRVNDSPMTFINKGYLVDNTTRNGSRQHPQTSLGNFTVGHSVPNGHIEHEAEGGSRANDARTDRDIFRGITDLVREDGRHQHNGEAKPTSYTNGCIIMLTIVILFAPVAVSGYVYWEHDKTSSLPCPTQSQGPSISPSKQRSDDEYLRLKKLVAEVKELQEKHSEMQKNMAQSRDGLSIREQRERRRNCTLVENNAYQSSLDILQEELSNKIERTEMECLMKKKHLSSKIQRIDRQLYEANSCIFISDNNTEVDNIRKTRKAQLTEHKNAASQFVGVTCCNENTTLNLVNAILEVKETTSNITYACRCPMSQNCGICYWKCGDDTSGHHFT